VLGRSNMIGISPRRGACWYASAAALSAADSAAAPCSCNRTKASEAYAGAIVIHPGRRMPNPPSILTKYCDHDMATTILETAYSRISAQPIIHANNSPKATYAYV